MQNEKHQGGLRLLGGLKKRFAQQKKEREIFSKNNKRIAVRDFHHERY
jgi:hypothetical protein